MDKDEYREEVLKQLREIKLNTEMVSIFSVVVDILLFFIMAIALFK